MQKGVLVHSGEGRLRRLRTGLEEPPGRAHLGLPCIDCSLDKEHLSCGEASTRSSGLGGGKAVGV